MQDGTRIHHSIHPAIRIVSFLVLASGSALGGSKDLLIASALTGLLYVLTHTRIQPAWKLLKRLRWLFLSLFIIYFWFTPGDPLFRFGPSLQGIETGVLRISSLIVLVIAAHLLLSTTSRAQLVSALRTLSGCLSWLGLNRDTMAVRIALTLETVPAVQQLVTQHAPAIKRMNKPVVHIGTAAADLFQRVIAHAKAAPVLTIEIPDADHPPLYQWGYPLALAIVFWLTS